MPRFELHIPAIKERSALNPFTRRNERIPAVPSRHRFWEIALDGASFSVAEGELPRGQEPVVEKEHTRKLPSEEQAQELVFRQISRQKRRGFVLVGPCRLLKEGGAAPQAGPSSLWLDEAYASEDPRFVEELVLFDKAEKLGSLAPRWVADTRPFARRALLAYVDDGCDRFGHKALVKRLFKLAEERGDDELMAHFMVAFDRLNARTLVKRWGAPVMLVDPAIPDKLRAARGKDAKPSLPRFTHATRRYLARRAFRYFRRIGHRDVARYGRAMRYALALYKDEHLSTPMRLLDAWGLVNALYSHSDVLIFGGRVTVATGRTLAELRPAPRFPAAYDGVFGELVPMCAKAGARPVRSFVLDLLRSRYSAELGRLTIDELRVLLTSPHEEAQELGATLLRSAKGAEKLRVEDWLALLEIPNQEIVAQVCDAVIKHVSPGRVSLDQAVALASSGSAPVARVGLSWAEQKPIKTADDLAYVLRLARAKVADVRADATRWIERLFAQPTLRVEAEHLRELFDAPFEDVRAVGLKLLAGDPRFAGDSSLWWAIGESPWADVQSFALRQAVRWLAAPGASTAGPSPTDTTTTDTQKAPAASATAPSARAQQTGRAATKQQFLATVVLAVHRGSAAKRRALEHMATEVARRPTESEELLPLIGHLARSVRPAERAVALASLARAVAARPELRTSIEVLVPGLSLGAEVTS